MNFAALGFLVDISNIVRRDGADASRWAGRVVLKRARGRVTVTANYVGAEGAPDGMLVDVDGASVRACRMVEAVADELADEIARRLGDPCSPEERRELARAGWYDDAAA